MTKKTFFEGIGAILIVVCIMGLVWAISQYRNSFGVDHKKEQVHVQFVLKVDSTGSMSAETRNQIDSLIYRMDIHEHLLQDKYEHILEQKEIFNDVIALGGMVLAVVLSIFGFFGYKSLNTIEERAKEQAKQAAEGFFKEQFEAYKIDTKKTLEGSLNIAVREKIEKDLAEYKKAVKNEIGVMVNRETEKYGNNVAEMKTAQESLEISMGNLDENVTKLQDRILKLEDIIYQPVQQSRRTLASAGGKVNKISSTTITPSKTEEEK